MMTGGGGGGGNTPEQWAQCCFDLKCYEGSIKLRQRLISNELFWRYYCRSIENWANTILLSLFTEYLLQWSSLELSPSVVLQVSKDSSPRTQVSGLRQSSPPPILSCQLVSLSGLGSLCKYAVSVAEQSAANYNQLDPPPPPPPSSRCQPGIPVSCWAEQVLPALQFKCPARAVCVGGPPGPRVALFYRMKVKYQIFSPPRSPPGCFAYSWAGHFSLGWVKSLPSITPPQLTRAHNIQHLFCTN